MIAALLSFLNIVLIIIISAVLLFLFVTALVLFVPVRYRIEAHRDSLDDSAVLFARASWLFSIVRVICRDNAVKVKLFRFITLGGKSLKKSAQSVSLESDNELKQKKTYAKKTQKSEYGAKKNKSGSKTDIIKRFNEIIQYPDKDVIIRYTFDLFSGLLSALKPEIFSVYAEIGLNDPSQTGILLGLIEVLKALTRLDVRVVGNFDKRSLGYRFKIGGSLTLWAFVRPILKYVIKKPIFNIIKKVLRRSNDNGDTIKSKP